MLIVKSRRMKSNQQLNLERKEMAEMLTSSQYLLSRFFAVYGISFFIFVCDR